MSREEFVAMLRDMKLKLEETIKRLEPEDLGEKCTCDERDSSFVCDVCYGLGYRGHMQEHDSVQCEECGLWSNSDKCEFC